MAMEERFDIFNEQMTRIGEAGRTEAHAEGLWHQTFHCWVIRRDLRHDGWQLLFQMRHPQKEVFPNKLDTSCAGHLHAGEAPTDGVRELAEELGLTVHREALRYCGTHPKENRVSERLIDREFNHIFLLECDKPLEHYTYALDEITGLYWIPLEAFRRLMVGDCPTVEADGIESSGQADGERAAVKRWFSQPDFAWGSRAYYELLFERISRLQQERAC